MSKLHTTLIARVFRIDAGHRLWKHEGKCRDIHGHSYTFQVYILGEDLDSVGRVIDFDKVKSIIGNWLTANWDHAMLLHKDDPIAEFWQMGNPFEDMKFCLFRQNPTAEVLAKTLLSICRGLLHEYPDLHVVKVECWETPNCMGIAEV